jgi:GT2 family glycosyltransferase
MKQAPDSDWYVLLNNDILLNKPISERVDKLDPKRIYGFCLYGPEPALFAWSYMPSWCYFYHKELWNKVGDFDEKCAPMYFEDADYCKRVQNKGYKMQVEDRVEWGILHLEGERHKERRAYMKQHMSERNSIRLYVRAKHGTH